MGLSNFLVLLTKRLQTPSLATEDFGDSLEWTKESWNMQRFSTFEKLVRLVSNFDHPHSPTQIQKIPEHSAKCHSKGMKYQHLLDAFLPIAFVVFEFDSPETLVVACKKCKIFS
jgi:hypothetical protein